MDVFRTQLYNFQIRSWSKTKNASSLCPASVMVSSYHLCIAESVTLYKVMWQCCNAVGDQFVDNTRNV